MLQIPDGLREDKEWLTLYLSGDPGLSRGAIEECELVLKLFVLMEKKTLIGPEKLEYFTKIMQSIENLAIVKDIEDYQLGILPPQQHQPYHNYPPQQYHQPQQQATPSFSQQNPQQWQHGQQPAIKKEPKDRTSNTTSGLTVGPEKAKWYYEAVQKNGVAYADKLWENVVQKMLEDEVMKKMQEINIAQQRRAAESMSSVKTEPGGDKREASVTRDLRLGPIEDTTRSQESEQSSTLTNEGQIVPAQTATDTPHPNTV
eukprot:XP_011680551.1 PREDICTED: uncharacterized protein LOC100891308 [Strongylocentrotus purpuratus]